MLKAYQFFADGLSDVHEVIHKPVLLPMHTMYLPCQLTLALALVLFVHSLFHLLLEVFYRLLHLLPSLRRLLPLETTANRSHTMWFTVSFGTGQTAGRSVTGKGT